MAGKRTPEIIIFDKEKEEKREGKGKSRLSRLRGRGITKEKNDVEMKIHSLSMQKQRLETEGINMKEMRKDIRSLNSSTLEGTSKKQSDIDYIKSLGGTGPKPVVIPYPHYLARLKKEKLKKKKELEILELTGSQVTSKKTKTRRRASKTGFWRDVPPKSLDGRIGQFKGGALKLTSKDIKSFK
ncbi:PREDICTED: uncharacterized protein LOC109583096 [Amphimedon queenslandica]|uniref:Uncharacterized protein n=1 Tax=Amphimedon queenslandica TaxID=400682 RepID=A0A1X7UJF2_AMPQE|nr:PREDICTED: uncharacterized protein LOC109583096 [Amphimedon queenslandica]|eukprot:XP_019853829.1 PREDICTED: uncharacterized protein LOC109583096 [Amphimedon queenslandica]